ncbi:MAG TPA: hypothetical protein V6D19_00210 [Stenomitos sp.]
MNIEFTVGLKLNQKPSVTAALQQLPGDSVAAFYEAKLQKANAEIQALRRELEALRARSYNLPHSGKVVEAQLPKFLGGV